MRNTEETTVIYGLRTDDLIDPIGLDSLCPRFSWKLKSELIGEKQTAYQIIVKSDEKIVWDSGIVNSDCSVGIKYKGEQIFSSSKYSWNVSVWNKDKTKFTSKEAYFETGLLEADAWKDAIWISCPSSDEEENNLAAYRKSVYVRDGLKTAKLYTSGLGVYDNFINGERVGRLLQNGTTVYDELKPGFTETFQRKFYNTYDITHMLNSGENIISSTVSSGWYTGEVVKSCKGKKTAYLAKIILTYADGTSEVINTDTTWKCSKASPLQSPTGIYDGETYNAMADLSYMKPFFDDSGWIFAEENKEFNGKISAWRGSPIRVRKDLERKAHSLKKYTLEDIINEVKDNYYGTINYKSENIFTEIPEDGIEIKKGEKLIVDFAQNGAGWENFEIKAGRRTVITIQHSEALCESNGCIKRGNPRPEGGLYVTSNRGAAAKTTYTASGNGIEAYHPTHTFYGFRYIEISATEDIVLYNVTAQTVTSVEENIGSVKTDNKDINRLIENVKWSMYSNFLAVPTDCPQRNERQGWTGDIQLFATTANYLGFSKSFLMKYMDDIRDEMEIRRIAAFPAIAPCGIYGGGMGNIGWSDAGVIIPYIEYAMYGDTSIIEENWDVMADYLDYLKNLGPFLELNEPERIRLMRYCGHLSLEMNADIWTDKGVLDGQHEKIQTCIAYYAWDAMLMYKMALAIGKKEEADYYKKIYDTQKQYYIANFVNRDGSLNAESQQSYLHALYLDLLPDENSVKAVTKQLVDNLENNRISLRTGFLGTGILLPTLTKLGRDDLAYSLLLSHNYPSWLYAVDNGATTMWERWDTFVKEIGWNNSGMNSLNHYAYGCVVGWIFENAAGIGFTDEAAGFKRIEFRPTPDKRLKNICAEYESAYGIISAENLYSDDRFGYKISVPANCCSAVYLPVNEEYCENITVNGKALQELNIYTDGIEYLSYQNGRAVFNTVSGEFNFMTNK